MSYILTKFGNTQLLPCAEASQDIGTGSVNINDVAFPGGGSYDQDGTEISARSGYSMSITGVIVGTSSIDFTNKFTELRSYLGTKNRLYRVSDSGDTQWAWARLVSLNATRKLTNLFHQEVSLTFFIFSPLWNGVREGSWRLDGGEFLGTTLDLDTALIYPLTGASTNIVIANDGNATQKAFELTITAKTSSITHIHITKTGETDISWTGTLVADTTLAFDMGSLSIRNNGLDAYSNMTISSSLHFIDDWAQLQPGNNTFTIARVGGDATSTVAVAYYDGWV